MEGLHAYRPALERTHLLSRAATSAPIFWLLGLILLCLRTEIGNWMAWVFAVAMGIVDAAHFVFPFMDTGHFGYFSGLYSAILLVPAGWYLGFRLYRASNDQALKRVFLWVLRHTLNPLVLRAARSGRAFSLVRHIGRRTGRTYETPLIVAPVEDGFVAELTYGTDVAWYRNVVAARRCVVVFKGVEYPIDGIEPYPAEWAARLRISGRADPAPAPAARVPFPTHSQRPAPKTKLPVAEAACSRAFGVSTWG